MDSTMNKKIPIEKGFIDDNRVLTEGKQPRQLLQIGSTQTTNPTIKFVNTKLF